jgi:hypothetical protein
MSFQYVQSLAVFIRDIKPIQQTLQTLAGAVPLIVAPGQQQDSLSPVQKLNSQVAAQKSGSTGDQDGRLPG